jgi:hypothetical protein
MKVPVKIFAFKEFSYFSMTSIYVTNKASINLLPYLLHGAQSFLRS